MAEYIHKGDLLEHLMYVNNDLPLITTEEWDIAKGFDKVVEEVKNYPTDDVQAVKHGRWKWSEGGQCSECGFHNSNFGYNYCPNCGADMRGEI